MNGGPRPWLPAVIERLRRAPAVVRVVVAQVQGSAPREPGAYLLVDAAGLTGTIGGGRLEWEALEAAREMLRQGVRAARLMNRVLGIDLGQCCGGVVAVWLECFVRDSLGGLEALAADPAGAPRVLVTRVRAGTVSQDLSGAGDAARLLLQLPRHQAAPRVQRTRAGEISFCERLDEAYPEVWLYGAGHVGQALAGMLVQLPLQLQWLDPRPGQFPPQAAQYSRVLPVPQLLATVAQAPPNTHFLVMTHDHSLDYDLCRAVLLRRDSAWLGLIGSQSKAARFRSRLGRDGFAAAAVAHLSCPIGVAGIRSKWPAAIAVAIAAQIMQILSQAADGEVRQQVAPPLDSCGADDCSRCGRQEQKIEGRVVTET